MDVTHEMAILFNLGSSTSVQKVKNVGLLLKCDEMTHLKHYMLITISGEMRAFQACDSDPALVKTMNAQCPVSQLLDLKQGAQVKLIFI